MGISLPSHRRQLRQSRRLERYTLVLWADYSSTNLRWLDCSGMSFSSLPSASIAHLTLLGIFLVPRAGSERQVVGRRASIRRFACSLRTRHRGVCVHARRQEADRIPRCARRRGQYVIGFLCRCKHARLILCRLLIRDGADGHVDYCPAMHLPAQPQVTIRGVSGVLLPTPLLSHSLQDTKRHTSDHTVDPR
jgi:hypothetical protein